MRNFNQTEPTPQLIRTLNTRTCQSQAHPHWQGRAAGLLSVFSWLCAFLWAISLRWFGPVHGAGLLMGVLVITGIACWGVWYYQRLRVFIRADLQD